MHDPRWMNQVYAYAYSTQTSSPTRKIDFAILTDFQEFVVLDCTLYAATPKAVGNFRVLDWHCDDYVTQFDTLWELFERDNVRQAARMRGTAAPSGLWARCLSPQKVQANRIPPDKAFLAEMDDDQTGWRVRLAKDMKKRNPQADGLLLTAAVQLLIDRLIFVKVLSDREIEEDYLSQLAQTVERDGLAESDTGWFTACRAIFDRLNRFYNGSIFEPRPELEAVAVSNKVVRDILRALQPENSPYNFAVLPVEILGTIYERFLGRVVRTTEKQVKIEDKPEVRKAGGVYYTPQYIVDYIVQNTVGRLLAECRTPEDVARLKILDPACGSGSFLLGAYQALIGWHVRYYGDRERLTKRDRAAAYCDSDGRVRLTARLKRQILLNNLFGVDIDPQAVEVTRLSLSLKALEDTRREELYDERTLFKQTVLPDLSGNVKCGNSLIGPDYFAGRMFPDADELRRVKPFDWKQAFPEIMAAGGFDTIIGNPPYVRPHNIPAEVKDLLWAVYSTFVAKSDLYSCFMERGLTLAKPTGLFSFIVPHTWTSLESFTKIREFFIRNARICKLVQLPRRVFTDAAVETCIFLVQRTARDTDSSANEVVVERLEPSGASAIVRHFPQTAIEDAYLYNFQLYGRDEGQVILEKVKRLGQPLSEYISFVYGFKTADDEQFIHPSRKYEENKLFIRSAAIHRYWHETPNEYVWYVPEQMIRNRKTARPGEAARFEAEKIMVARMGKSLIAAHDIGGLYVKDAMMLLGKGDPHSLKYLLGIINSRLLDYFYREFFVTIDILKNALVNLPIRPIDFSSPADRARHDRMVQLVEAMLALHKHKTAARTQAEQDLYQRQIEATDREIDLLVYELYGLTADEIAVVEGRG
jgi:type I restriction-modification system DNA methylase subunit